MGRNISLTETPHMPIGEENWQIETPVCIPPRKPTLSCLCGKYFKSWPGTTGSPTSTQAETDTHEQWNQNGCLATDFILHWVVITSYLINVCYL